MDKSINAIRNAKVQGYDALVDLNLKNGKIESITSARDQECSGTNEYDAQGCVVLPGLIDAHTHIDKSFNLGKNEVGSLFGAIESMREIKQSRALGEVVEKAEFAILQAMKNGTTLLRSHIDIGNTSDLDVLEAILALKKRYEKKIRLDCIALGSADTPENFANLKRAMALGADMVGGAPALSESPEVSIAHAIQLARDFNTGLDLHIDEHENTGPITLEILLRQLAQEPLGQPVLVSHCCALGHLDDDYLDHLLKMLVKENISLVTLPMCNLYLMGKTTHPSTRGVPPVQKLLDNGVNVVAASDNVQDPFNPYGKYSALQAAQLAGLVGNLTTSSEITASLDFVTHNAANALEIRHYGVDIDCDANLAIFNTSEIEKCVLTLPETKATFFHGNLVYEKQSKELWH